MPKSRKRRQNKGNPKPKTPHMTKPQTKRKWRDSLLLIKKWSLWTWALIVSTGVIVGLLTGPLVLIPRVTVTPSSTLDPSDPFSAPFIISNDSTFAIYDVKFPVTLKTPHFQITLKLLVLHSVQQ